MARLPARQPRLVGPESRVLAFTLAGFPAVDPQEGVDDDVDIHVMINMDWQDLDFDVPPLATRRWFRAIDTARPSPADITARGEEEPFDGVTCRVRDRSIVVLISR